MVLVGHPPQHLFLNQVVEALGEDVTGDSQARLEVVEARYPEEGVSDNEEAPPFADHVQTLSDGAAHVLETGSLHDLSLPGSLMERTEADETIGPSSPIGQDEVHG